ncbi:hypothetical protein F5B22DRAFT_636062 [Xylaria bambusicola]|uniref:uncharacterized protein n=1 Tax=Xylaria bambusicola TaxID=326684 RepID=UPI0020089BBB|nr:uncharacterized protein F5B22DRAFT_636062 [Xylaria bambusicola]KAI0517130.1 hypothetical protein F5B22DRAFT_636062 [Xylaria bambusicola]
MSVYRLALKGILESCFGQGAWIWVSTFRKGKTEAKLEDFKMFDEASREIPLACKTASCIWPIFPSLAVCGGCTESFFTTSCDPQKGCSHSMPSGTSVHSQVNDPFNYHFRVAPSNGSATFPDNSSEAVISMFDIISAETSPQNNVVQAYQCGLWFCLKSYNVTVTNGVQTRFVTREWSRSELNAQTDEHFFVDIPPEMNAQQYARYSVPLGALSALRAFIDKLTLGNARTSQATDVVVHDTDWIQAIEAATKVDLSVWISRFAHSLTQHIQLTGTVQPNKNSDYNGMAYIMAPHVVVNWYWVVYPISLMFLAFVYFMLFCHVSSDIHEQVQDGMDMPGGLKRRVGSTEVELMRQHNGEWVFTRPRHH